MVRVRAGLCSYVPCLFPCQPLFVNEQPHQLRNCHRRVSIVHLDDYFFIQLANIAVFLLVFCDQRLKARRDEEILLFQTKLFS